MRHLIYIISLLSFCFLQAQTAVSPPNSLPSDNNKNWTSSISYDFNGNTISKGINYFNDLGKPTQQQSWDVLTERLWGSEVRYDYFNRPVLQTLSAPTDVSVNGPFYYRNSFIIKSGGNALTIDDYDTTANLYNPPQVSPAQNTLGWYYSSSNNLDLYQDITSYPYTRVVYSELNPGAVKQVLGGNKINGQWLQTYSFTMPMETSLTASDMPIQLQGKQVVKTISRDVKGTETVVFTDTDGNTLGAARSGNEELNAPTPHWVTSQIVDNDYVDIHIPHGCDQGGANIYIDNATPLHNIIIYNLITETTVTLINGNTLPPGFYRFEDVNKVYSKTVASGGMPTSLQIRHKVNYYDYALNQYDEAGRLKVSIQPLGSNTDNQLASTFEYNSLGQLLSTTSPDEGQARFKYRRDGQIRFSQNTEQAKLNHFSYTNYDDLGRPLESGVCTESDVASFDDLEAIVDDSTTPLSGLLIERNISFYDQADPTLIQELEKCELPTQEYVQTHLSGNVSYTYTLKPDTNKTWYSYDVYGRVKWMIQKPNGLQCLKTIDYTYNPINGQLVRVDYQRHSGTERFVHQYTYNEAGQLTDVHTATETMNFQKQAHYVYNESGALIRTELANNLQGIDYVYNLAGQLKAINHPSILPSLDPGGDSLTSNGFIGDVFGMGIDYHLTDYNRITPKPITSTGYISEAPEQYNGNIKSIRWNTQVGNASQNGYYYRYNKNNWMKDATYGMATTPPSDPTFAQITPNFNKDYEEKELSYDANGNIQTLTRHGYTGNGASNSRMDKLTYNYGSLPSNRLLYVKDEEDYTADPNRYSDIRDQEQTIITGSTTSASSVNYIVYANTPNYIYNDLGQLTMNLQDKIIYEYNAAGLVTKISTFADTNNAQEYKTMFYDDYSHFDSFTHGWYRQGNQSTTTAQNMEPFTLGFPNSDLDQCSGFIDSFQTLYGYHEVLQINGAGINRKFFRVTPNTSYKLSLDAILDKLIYYETDISMDPGGNIPDPTELNNNSGTGEDYVSITMNPTVKVRIKRADGTDIVPEQIIIEDSDPNQIYCSRYSDSHYFTEFTTTNEEYFTLEIEVLNNNGNPQHSKHQQTFLDNIKLEAATMAKVAFYYDDRGQRIRKQSFMSYGNSADVYYVRDASGNVMGVYEHGSGPSIRVGPPKLVEHSMFGNSRIGVFKRTDGKYRGYGLYELTDHLGNVRAVLQKTGPNVIAITNKTDYYPFGMPMPNKTTTDGLYRYAFQGQEKDPETGMEAFELRLWDGRLGRWLTVDPYHEFYSPYVGMGNNPVSLIDPDGGCTGGPGDPPMKGTGTTTDPFQLNEVVIIMNRPAKGIGSMLTHEVSEISQRALASFSGFANAFGSNHLLGLGRRSPDHQPEHLRKDYFYGQFAGDVFSIPAGITEIFVGATVDLGAVVFALPSGGTSTIAIPVGTAVAGMGVSATSLGILNTARDIQYFNSMDDVHPTGGSSGGKGGGYKKPKAGLSGKEAAKDVPDWAKGNRPYIDENGSQFAKRLMDEKYGPGNWSGTGPTSEFSKIKKWGDRAFE